MTSAVARSVEITVADGARFVATAFDGRADLPAVGLVPAMGVEASYYERLQRALGEVGVASLAMDLRGLGGSSLRAGRDVDFGYRETVEVDLPAQIAEIRRLFPDRPVVLWGHSLGGQLACLHVAGFPGSVDGLVLVACCSVWSGAFPFPARLAVALLQRVALLSSRVLGHFPGRTIGFGGRESRGVIADWAFQGRTGEYRIRGGSFDPEARLRDLDLPIRVVHYTDDGYCPEGPVLHLLGKMPRAHIERTARSPEEVGAASVGHFSWARRPEVVLGDVLPWLEGLSGLSPESSDA